MRLFHAVSAAHWRVVRELSIIAGRHGLPCMVVSDNHTDLIQSCCTRLVTEHWGQMA